MSARRQPQPGNAWTALATPASIEPANKIAALQELARSIPEATPYRTWFLHNVNLWACSTGSSLAHVLGLHRSGIPSPHRVAYLETRDAQVRIIAASLPHATDTKKARTLAAIVQGTEKAPSARVERLVIDLTERFAGDVPTESRQYLRILQGEATGTGE